MISIDVEYLGNSSDNEVFTYDSLGNRITHNPRVGSDIVYTLNSPNTNNEYATIGGNSLAYDGSGNMTGDHQGYQYFYDYENRLTEIQDDQDNLVAKYEYDALGRRIESIKYETGGNVTTRYYYDGWRVLAETNENDIVQREYVYGNYLDEVLVMTDASNDHYYAHDHLFSPVALIDEDGDILERYEYDAYGKCTFLDSGFNPLGTQASGHGNTRLFTGQVLDILDDGDFLIMYYKNRYYAPETGRFITIDPVGVRSIPLLSFSDPRIANLNGPTVLTPYIVTKAKGNITNLYRTNEFIISSKNITPKNSNKTILQKENIKYPNQYIDGMNLYQLCKSNPISYADPLGLKSEDCGFGVYCGDIMDESIGAWIADRIFQIRHCDLDTDPDSGRKDEVKYDVWIDRSKERTLMGGKYSGTPCTCASCNQIEDCALRVQAEIMANFEPLGRNCHTATSWALSKCCFKTNWEPGWYALYDGCLEFEIIIAGESAMVVCTKYAPDFND